MSPVHIIGGGLAGCEAAWQLARRGVPAVLHEMRPARSTAVHKTSQLAELVCSNSFRSDDAQGSAIGLLHAEMRRLQSLIMQTADANKLPAGSALAVDRDGFAAALKAQGVPKDQHRQKVEWAAGLLGIGKLLDRTTQPNDAVPRRVGASWDHAMLGRHALDRGIPRHTGELGDNLLGLGPCGIARLDDVAGPLEQRLQ